MKQGTFTFTAFRLQQCSINVSNPKVKQPLGNVGGQLVVVEKNCRDGLHLHDYFDLFFTMSPRSGEERSCLNGSKIGCDLCGEPWVRSGWGDVRGMFFGAEGVEWYARVGIGCGY